jgi:hypothetical protein
MARCSVIKKVTDFGMVTLACDLDESVHGNDVNPLHYDMMKEVEWRERCVPVMSVPDFVPVLELPVAA